MEGSQVLFKVIEQVFSLFLLGLIGFIASKTNTVSKSTGVHLSSVVVKITAPLLIFFTMAGYTMTPALVKTGITIYFVSFVLLLIVYMVSIGQCHFSRMDFARKKLYSAELIFGNVIFMAYPLLFMLFGSEGIIYSIFFNIANDTLLWTLGVYLIDPEKSVSVKKSMKKIINQNTMAFAGGIVVLICKLLYGNIFAQTPHLFKVIEIFNTTLLSLGKTTIYLSMIFIGMILAEVNFGGIKDIFSRKYAIIYSLTKLILIPFIVIIIFHFMGGFMDKLSMRIIAIQLAMPGATIITALAAEYKADYRFTTELVFYSTVLSMITLPLIITLIYRFT